VHVIDHPLIQHKLTLMRRQDTGVALFRTLLREISMLMAYAVTQDLPLTESSIETPVAPMQAPILAGPKPVLVSVLRAGNGFLDGFLDVLPSARVGHLGFFRDPQTLAAVHYYEKMPSRLDERRLIVLDPMLATGHTAVAALDKLAAAGAKKMCFVALLSAPEGIVHVHQRYPEVPIYTATLDSHLNDHGYIVPGLGDAGDRMYGTR
jgi:uracil phosphoribosyltransferase